ncbi:MAG: sulfatase [Actinomycetota bacterium]|nr:sulfatase [Actinomycetota bacterium]
MAEPGVLVARRARAWIGLSFGAALIMMVAAMPDAPARQASGERRPNVLLIVTDDQRDGTVDAMPTTAAFFGAKGRSFTNAFATSPMCCPSRASIMTGRYPHNHEVRRNADGDLLDQKTTLQYYLRQAGYQTAMAGKYLNGWDETRQDPPHFDRWAAIDDEDYASVYVDFIANVNGTLRLPRGYSTDYIGRKATSFLETFEERDRQPWFMYLAPFAPHKPFVTAPKYRSADTPEWHGSPAVSEDDRSDKPEWVQKHAVPLARAQEISTEQYRLLMSVDDMVARVADALDRLDEARDTIAIFMSDNGYMWGEHGLVQKRFPYTKAAKIPLLVRWPGHIEENTTDGRLAANIDIAPTIMAAAGIEPDPAAPVDGRSLLSETTRDRVLMEFFGAPGKSPPPWAGIRSESYQYVEYYDKESGEVVAREYYDLTNDPWQLVNLYGDGDPLNDPALTVHQADLALIRECRGSSCP